MRPISVSDPTPIGPLTSHCPLLTLFTCALTLIGFPWSLSVWPPRLTSISFPGPALAAFAAATRSQMTPKTPPVSPSSRTALMTKVLSQGVPPPGLSPMSARTIGPSLAAFTLFNASLTGIGLTRKSLRIDHARSLSSWARASACFWSLFVTTMKLMLASFISLQGKPAATVTASTPGSCSILCASSKSFVIGCLPVN